MFCILSVTCLLTATSLLHVDKEHRVWKKNPSPYHIQNGIYTCICGKILLFKGHYRKYWGLIDIMYHIVS